VFIITTRLLINTKSFFQDGCCTTNQMALIGWIWDFADGMSMEMTEGRSKPSG
jgi:hypothetical protein